MELFWHLHTLKSKAVNVWKVAAVPLQLCPLSALKDVLHPKILMEGGASKPTNNPSPISKNTAVKEQVWIPTF